MKIGIVYHTSEGHTAEIAERLASVLGAAGHTTEIVPLRESGPDISQFDGLVVGGSVHTGSHGKELEQFVEHHRSAFQLVPSAFFSVSLSASRTGTESQHADAARLAHDFLTKVDWDPEMVGLFGGAVLYTKYGFIKRFAMKHIVGKAGGDTDTSRDFDYTDWDAVEQFARDFATFAEAHRAMTLRN